MKENNNNAADTMNNNKSLLRASFDYFFKAFVSDFFHSVIDNAKPVFILLCIFHVYMCVYIHYTWLQNGEDFCDKHFSTDME